MMANSTTLGVQDNIIPNRTACSVVMATHASVIVDPVYAAISRHRDPTIALEGTMAAMPEKVVAPATVQAYGKRLVEGAYAEHLAKRASMGVTRRLRI